MSTASRGLGIDTGYPAELERDAVLGDGTPVHIRPIRPSDAGGLVAFHARLSPETVYGRFFSPRPALSEQEVARFTMLDYHDRFALVATAGDAIVGVARFDRHTSDAAEVAFVVDDAHQGHGLGSLLLQDLAAAARQRTIGRFDADTLAANTPMLRVFRDAGFPVRWSVSTGVVHVDLTITTADGPKVPRTRVLRS